MKTNNEKVGRPGRVETVYRCSTCRKVYASPKEAEVCVASDEPYPTDVEIGDLVVTGQEFGWHDGDSRWIYSRKRKPENYDGYASQFIYVVTAIDRDPGYPHSWRIHIRTRAMTGEKGYRGGWTTPDHYAPKKITTRKPIRAEADALIGQKNDILL